ncbi:MAG: EAL domain-containing protein [Azonexaceae bacterium]|nr:EAL domain-containing protein [Azonexaceae bacterium]
MEREGTEESLIFDTAFGQSLVDLLAAELGFVCNFMDGNGRIVASSDIGRLGQVHEIAARIMAGDMDEYAVTAAEAQASGIMREGVNMAIDHAGRRLTCFSIAGPLAAVQPIARVVKFSVVSAHSVHRAKRTPHLGQAEQPQDLNCLLGATEQNIEASLAQLRRANAVAEARVREQTARLREFAELSSDWFWEQDENFRFIEFSGSATERLGREVTHFIGKQRWELPLTGVSPEALAAHIATCEAHRPFRDFEYRIAAQDGSQQVFLVSGVPVFDEAGAFRGYRGTGRNVTALHRAEMALRESEQRLLRSERKLSQIVDGSSIATFVIDAGHRVTHWNKACAQLTGHAADEMLGKTGAWRAFYERQRPTMADLVLSAPDDRLLERHYAWFSRSAMIAGAIDAEGHFPGTANGGRGRWLYFTAAPLIGDDGTLIGAIETIQDISDRKRAQNLLEQQTAALQQANSEMERRIEERTAQLSEQLDLMKQLFEAIPGPVFYKSDSGLYLGCNAAFAGFIGRPTQEIIGRNVFSLAPRALAEIYDAADAELLRRGGSQIYETQVQHADGQVRDVVMHKAAFYRSNGTVSGMIGLMVDITERHRLEDELRQAATVFESSTEGVMITRADGEILAVNRAFTEITGYAAAEAITRNPRFLQSGRHDRHFFAAMWAQILQQGRWQGELWNRRKNGEIYPQRSSIVAVRDGEGRVGNYVATFSDITRQKANEEQIQRLAFSDPLTGLANRRLLIDRLQEAIGRAGESHGCGALLFIDLDGFKDINDTRGHEIGDLLLVQVAERLRDCVGARGTVARIGGDEFVVLLEGLDGKAIQAKAQVDAVGSEIIRRLNEVFPLAGLDHLCTPSIGATCFDSNRFSVTDLLKQADMAMYEVKSAGRNALRFYDPQMQTAILQRVRLESELREAIRQAQFFLDFQPQVDEHGAVVGVEALVRWLHPDKGILSPWHFIDIAERTGLIVPLGAQIFSMACRQLREWSDSLPEQCFTLAINVSARQFHEPDFVDFVCQLIRDQAIDPARLKIELTESIFIDQVDETIRKMERLREEGIRFSLDDFGTGYSSLSYLHRLPFEQIKIDQSFVRHALDDRSMAAIVRTIVGLAANLNISVIAEGVETEAQARFLGDNGCRTYQGYLYSRPMSASSFAAFVQAREQRRAPPNGL